jgi:hypothetical protein
MKGASAKDCVKEVGCYSLCDEEDCLQEESDCEKECKKACKNDEKTAESSAEKKAKSVLMGASPQIVSSRSVRLA